ncbi:MAG TPA: DUF2846 domain-containing protein [Syntrophales bacterium]|nr:DUF2846 domain-containing protein [Syntrophales bacterium]
MRSCINILLALTLSACATGPKYSVIKTSFQPLATGEGRIFFYRSYNPFGSATQPSVMLNGEKVGDSVPGGFFFVNREPGNYEVVLSTKPKRKLSFTLDEAQERYVRLSVVLGVIAGRVYPELVDKTTAESEMQGLSFTGTTAKGE